MPSDRLASFCRGQKLTIYLACPHCESAGTDLRLLKGHKVTVSGYDYNRHYQRLRCLNCNKLFIYWYDKRKVSRSQLKLPEIDSVEKVEPLTEEEKLARWYGDSPRKPQGER